MAMTERDRVITETPEQVRARAERRARDVLGCSFDEALEAIDAGEYRGSLIEMELRSYRWLLDPYE